jgi:hypothetical protein
LSDVHCDFTVSLVDDLVTAVSTQRAHRHTESLGQTDDGVFIELTLRGHLGRRPVEWTVVDRIILEDGLIRERRSYFDPAPLLKAVALRPRASLPLLLSLLTRG